jgi:threonine dehydrogenase-like Zn-dependent dehydrogenase
MIGTQAEQARIPLADGTLVPVAGEPNAAQIPHLPAASDVLGTGWFAAVAAEAGPGKTVAVVGDGAVGPLGVLAAVQLGAERIIAMSPRDGPAPRHQGSVDAVTARNPDVRPEFGSERSMYRSSPSGGMSPAPRRKRA